MYLLDTNIVSYWMRGDRGVMDRIKQHSPLELAISTITIAEILYGIEKSPTRKKERKVKIGKIRSLLKIYSFDEASTEKYAAIRYKLEKSGAVISERDIQIASIAKANRLIVVTHNTKEFDRVNGLKVEDWA